MRAKRTEHSVVLDVAGLDLGDDGLVRNLDPAIKALLDAGCPVLVAGCAEYKGSHFRELVPRKGGGWRLRSLCDSRYAQPRQDLLHAVFGTDTQGEPFSPPVPAARPPKRPVGRPRKARPSYPASSTPRSP